MKKAVIIGILVFIFSGWACLLQPAKKSGIYPLRETVPDTASYNMYGNLLMPAANTGDADAGFLYMTRGDGFGSGIPAWFYRVMKQFTESKWGAWSGYGQNGINTFTVFRNNYGKKTAAPGCFTCHAMPFNNTLVYGLGNSGIDYTRDYSGFSRFSESLLRILYSSQAPERKNAAMAFASLRVLSPYIHLEVRGLTPTQKIAEVMSAHRDPHSLVFREDTVYYLLPDFTVPEDVPALWLAKKRKAFTVNAMRQGDLLKHITSTYVLTLLDSSEARAIHQHSADIWAWIKSLKAPVYPRKINSSLALAGKALFRENCSRCHGIYEGNGSYPNLVIPPDLIGTDPLLWKYCLSDTGYSAWFNRSWFARSGTIAENRPQKGYVPPPLDGVWITAPYFHNGSVPDLASVLNSKLRPRYWKRNFNALVYDYDNLGWKYESLNEPGNRAYNTDIPGYGNYGHNFGDKLTVEERKAVLEYLKTL